MAMVFSKQRFDFVRKTKTEMLKNILKTKKTGKKYFFPAKCIENSVVTEKHSQQNRGKWARKTK